MGSRKYICLGYRGGTKEKSLLYKSKNGSYSLSLV